MAIAAVRRMGVLPAPEGITMQQKADISALRVQNAAFAVYCAYMQGVQQCYGEEPGEALIVYDSDSHYFARQVGATVRLIPDTQWDTLLLQLKALGLSLDAEELTYEYTERKEVEYLGFGFKSEAERLCAVGLPEGYVKETKRTLRAFKVKKIGDVPVLPEWSQYLLDAENARKAQESLDKARTTMKRTR